MTNSGPIFLTVLPGLFLVCSIACAEPMRVEVRDFLPATAAHGFPVPFADLPSPEKPEPLLTREQLEMLPAGDRLVLLQREQAVAEEWQKEQQKRQVDRYREEQEERTRTRDYLLCSDEGRALTQARGIMESAMAAYGAQFILQRAGECTDCPCRIDGTVGDLTDQRVEMLSGWVKRTVIRYRLPVQITLTDNQTGQILASYSREQQETDGSGTRKRGEIMLQLLRNASREAAAQFAERVERPTCASGLTGIGFPSAGAGL